MDQQTLAAYDLEAADFAAQWHDQPAPHEPLFRSISLGDTRSIPNHLERFHPAETITRLGIQRSTGLTPLMTVTPWRPTPATAFSYRLVRIPYSTLLFAPLIIPISRVVSLLTRRAIARRRRSRGLCATCGYDMRSSPGRCPECGQTDKLRDPNLR